MLVKQGLMQKVQQLTSDIYFEGASADKPTDQVIKERSEEIIELMREEAIALADGIIGKDRIIHSEVDLREGEEIMDKADKAVFDFQVKQRVSLAKYQNPVQHQVGPSGPQIVLNSGLSPNEE